MLNASLSFLITPFATRLFSVIEFVIFEKVTNEISDTFSEPVIPSVSSQLKDSQAIIIGICFINLNTLQYTHHPTNRKRTFFSNALRGIGINKPL